MTTRTEQMKQRRAKEYKFLKLALFALLLLVVATAASYYWFTSSSLPTPKRNKQTNVTHALGDSGGKVNILVLGVDQRKDDIGRSDTLFLLTLDTKKKDIALLSIPRDTRVLIPGYGFDKINHTYGLGGHQLTQQTVEDLLGTPVDYYLEIDFAGFNKIVDAVGGVDIAVEKRMFYEDPYDDLVIDLQPGLQHMNGETAIKYVRYRDEEGDIGRIERQQKFVKAMVDEVTSPGILVRLPAIISEVSKAVRTDLSLPEMIGIGKSLNDAKQRGLKAVMLPATPIDIGGVSYLHPDVTALRDHMAELFGTKKDGQYTAAVKRLASAYQDSLPDETMLAPEKAVTPDKAKRENAKSVVKAKEPVKPPVQKPATQTKPPAEPSQIKADIVNASGDPAAGEKMAAQLRRQGFTVVQISSVGNVNRNTIVIAKSSQESILSKLTSLPFDYALQVSPQARSATQVTVVIGKDYK